MTYLDVSVLVGKIISKITQTTNEIYFHVDDDEGYIMFHEQDCCEDVFIEDICGDLDDLVGSEILSAQEVSGATPSSDLTVESESWTFYLISTIKGSVTIRWYGTSNGYYSESVSFRKV